MPIITVSTALLREKARLIRAVLDEQKTAHQQLWSQISANASLLPSDLHATHTYANAPWNTAVLEHYDNYYQLALNMEAAADVYERGDKNYQIAFMLPN